MHDILVDIQNRLNIKIDEKNIKNYTNGSTDAKVFSINDEYLIKVCDVIELNVYNEFMSKYQNDCFQKLYYINYELNYVCLSFIKGRNYSNTNNLDINYMLEKLYDITSSYKIIEYDGFGYLFEDHKTWSEFLTDEINHSISILNNDIDTSEVKKALDNISDYDSKKYLLHGDFGIHNFIVNNNKLYVIDPIGLVGDPIYDFYFAIFSNPNIFTKINFNILLNYFDRDIDYKKSMMIITFFIRLCRTYKYHIDNFDLYLNYYNKLINNFKK